MEEHHLVSKGLTAAVGFCFEPEIFLVTAAVRPRHVLLAVREEFNNAVSICPSLPEALDECQIGRMRIDCE